MTEPQTRRMPPPPPPLPTAQRPPAPAAPPQVPPPAVISSKPSGLTLAQLIKEAFDEGYSDVHLGVGEIPRFRSRGEIQTTSYPEADKPTFMGWLREILSDAEIQRFQEHLEFDGATQYDFARVRINVFDSLRGYAMVLRLIPLKILSMEQLRLPPVFQDICHQHKGLVLVTGPTGSGKSTTMAAMVDYINREMAKHIITIEDPVEFVHQSRKSLVKQREVGMHTLKFDNALKAALREDPDLILVGEMRDKETVNTALKAAQTGHLVMGTLHTNSAVKTIERILNLYSGEEQEAMRVALAESLVAVIAQGLCRTTDGKRAAFHDVLINTEAVKEWVKDGKYDEIGELMKQAGFDGMVTMNQSLLNLYQEGRITEETALEMSPTPNEMAQFLRGRV
ncbi:type IV pilus twitching motility protein PilT [Dolichospermum sp. ST_sed1]|nr:type IV pilus twitching motility protein PilT [Dolichospermum sp. ST_sed1]MDD1423550.1 type IV pilus twitching motility protein PilT [Dolichospermum sp. ST_sed9]MDD1431713.1 type IV pilus twitching motility protein PilT [Dolichospermum sp. ST_sed6]MDD1440574.1 type IV pilus twitching motility protein PilT [Dolichospermum sp. ST_sed3]MDD1445517.1 type IV pilus twitching motility protein PilT [Dolichospermum sp. ST_sed8]MDD1453660.1 type IV pilus twitching motility protein PilT [Dolichospermu